MNGKRVLVALTGGIACYKVAALVSRLVQNGADVTALMTEAATKFIGPLTFESLSGNPVISNQWQQHAHFESQHVATARNADLMVIAPASANTLAKLAAGFADNAVTTTALALPAGTPLLLAPAMNSDMWEKPVTQQNVDRLRSLPDVHWIGPEEGWQACRTKGMGRMSEPDMIYAAVEQLLGV